MRIRRIGLAWKLASAFLLLVALALSATFKVADDSLGTAVEGREFDKVSTTGRVIAALMAKEAEHLQLVAALMPTQGDLAASMLLPPATRASTLAAALAGPFSAARVDELEIVDRTQSTVYRAKAPGHAPHDHRSLWGVEEALGGAGSVVSSVHADGLVLHAVEPVRAGARVVGAVIVGRRLDDEFFRALSVEVGADVALGARDARVLASNGGAHKPLDAATWSS